MSRDAAHQVLQRIGVIRHPCDLDLLLFFVRHPRALLTSDQLATWLGYEARQLAESLDVLLKAGFVTRTQNPARSARMYVLAAEAPGGSGLPALLKMASTRVGRLALIDAISHQVEPHALGRGLARPTPQRSRVTRVRSWPGQSGTPRTGIE